MSPATKAKALDKLRQFTPKIGYPDQVARLLRADDRARDDLIGNVAARQRCSNGTARSAASTSRWTDRMGHDAADHQRLLQSDLQRDRLPGRHPAAAVLRSEGRRRGQLRRHRRGDRPRDQPRLRRPGQQVRRRRQAAQTGGPTEDAPSFDSARPRRWRRSIDAYEPLPGAARQRQA